MPTTTKNLGAAEAAPGTPTFTRVPLTLTGVGDRVTGVACVQRIATKTSRISGTTFIDIDVGHAEAQTTLRVWSNKFAAWRGITEGAAVALTLESKKGWRPGTFEWALKEVALLPEQHPVCADMLPRCSVPPAELTPTADVSCRSPDGRRTPAFAPGALPAPVATPPRPRPMERTLHLVVLRDTAATPAVTPSMEVAP